MLDRSRGIMCGVALAVAACAQQTPAVPSSPASVEGRITAIDRAGERIGSIRVEANPAETSGSDKAAVRITESTVILRGDTTRSDFKSLALQQWVRVWFTGPVRESYPVQADAGVVQIDDTR
ncbi:MAG: DUF3221 domain-containing protein [Gemmatimonadaceae bacterium]